MLVRRVLGDQDMARRTNHTTAPSVKTILMCSARRSWSRKSRRVSYAGGYSWLNALRGSIHRVTMQAKATTVFWKLVFGVLKSHQKPAALMTIVISAGISSHNMISARSGEDRGAGRLNRVSFLAEGLGVGGSRGSRRQLGLSGVFRSTSRPRR